MNLLQITRITSDVVINMTDAQESIIVSKGWSDRDFCDVAIESS